VKTTVWKWPEEVAASMRDPPHGELQGRAQDPQQNLTRNAMPGKPRCAQAEGAYKGMWA